VHASEVTVNVEEPDSETVTAELPEPPEFVNVNVCDSVWPVVTDP
jgi:hypothetical protein